MTSIGIRHSNFERTEYSRLVLGLRRETTEELVYTEIQFVFRMPDMRNKSANRFYSILIGPKQQIR